MGCSRHELPAVLRVRHVFKCVFFMHMAPKHNHLLNSGAWRRKRQLSVPVQEETTYVDGDGEIGHQAPRTDPS